MYNLLRVCVTIAVSTALLLAGSPAQANAGLPMLFLVWPAMWALLVPIILLEALVATRILHIGFLQATQIAGVANVLSTFVGIPITWILLLIVEMNVGKGGGVYGLDRLPGKILSVTLQSPWLLPYKEKWIIPAAELFLCIPFFFMSVLTEFISAKWFVQGKLPIQSLLDWAWLANALSYSIIAGIVVYMLLRALDPRVSNKKYTAGEQPWFMPLGVQLFLMKVVSCGVAIASFVARRPTMTKPKKLEKKSID